MTWNLEQRGEKAPRVEGGGGGRRWAQVWNGEEMVWIVVTEPRWSERMIEALVRHGCPCPYAFRR